MPEMDADVEVGPEVPRVELVDEAAILLRVEGRIPETYGLVGVRAELEVGLEADLWPDGNVDLEAPLRIELVVEADPGPLELDDDGLELRMCPTEEPVLETGLEELLSVDLVEAAVELGASLEEERIVAETLLGLEFVEV